MSQERKKKRSHFFACVMLNPASFVWKNDQCGVPKLLSARAHLIKLPRDMTFFPPLHIPALLRYNDTKHVSTIKWPCNICQNNSTFFSAVCEILYVRTAIHNNNLSCRNLVSNMHDTVSHHCIEVLLFCNGPHRISDTSADE